MHAGLCVCDLIPRPRLETRTKLVLFIHRAEDRKSSNTGRLAAACLANSAIVVRGRENVPSAFVPKPGDPPPVLLFPYEDANPLGDLPPGPVTLVVPDGTWRQASKARSRIAGLRNVPCVSLPPGAPSSYRLRRVPQPERLATIEAVARALGILEGADVQRALERVFIAMVERTLESNGELGRSDGPTLEAG